MHCIAQAYGRRPSEVLGIEEAWAAYQLDAAVLTLGRWAENRLAEHNKDGSPRWTIEHLLGTEKEPAERQWLSARSLMRYGKR